MEKRVLLEPDVDERRLKIVLQILHAALEDASDKPLLLTVLDHELLEATVLHYRHARFEFLYVYNDFALRF